MVSAFELRHPKEGHSNNLSWHLTPAFHSAHQNRWPTLMSYAFWVQQDQGGNIKCSALGESLRFRRMLEWKLRM
jgi:hypothetical protein